MDKLTTVHYNFLRLVPISLIVASLQQHCRLNIALGFKTLVASDQQLSVNMIQQSSVL